MKIFPNSYLFLLDFQMSRDDLSVNLMVFHGKEKLERSSPVFTGRVVFTPEKGKYRPYKFEEHRGNHVNYQKAKDAIEVFRAASLVAIPSHEVIPQKNKFLEFINTFKISTPKIVEICPHCLRDQSKITIMRTDNQYNFYGKIICRLCALGEVRDDFTKSGIQMTSSVRKFVSQQLETTKSVEKSVALVQTSIGYQPKDADSTLYDVIEADTTFKVRPLKRFILEHTTKNEVNVSLLDYWQKIGVKSLLPVQQLAIQAGLFQFKDLLIIAGTSSGKTFVGELAGLNVFKQRNQKFLFLTPLVALTNQKYEQFKSRYREIGARVAIRVGVSRLNVGDEEKTFIDGNIQKADIIVGTYEAFDWVLRSGKQDKLGDIGVLVIDEVQLLADSERGQELDGLIARTRTIFPNVQIICLSATVGNPEEIASNMGLELVKYEKRPVALERHLVLTESKEEKERTIAKLVKDESKQKSSFNYPGKTIVFTNSRRRAQQLASILRSEHIRSTYYHAGMTYYDRKRIEVKFEKNQFEVITTTAALGAGVDFPVSQVIFERPAMGARWLTVSEFHQMFGRAGRFGYHDQGKMVLLVTQGEKIYSGMDKSEEHLGFELLTERIEDVDLEIEVEKELDQILSIVSALNPIKTSVLKSYYNHLYFRTDRLNALMESLQKLGMVVDKQGKVYVTALGRATNESFLLPTMGYQLAKRTLKEAVEDIAISMTPFENIYLSTRAHAEVEQAAKAIISPRFLSDGSLDTIFGSSATRGAWTSTLAEKVKLWSEVFFNCRCLENPYCDHPQHKISQLILTLRKSGLTPKQISAELTKDYFLFAYPGDLYSWLDQIIHSIQAISRLARAMKQENKIQESKELTQEIAHGGKTFVKKKKSNKNPKKKSGESKSKKGRTTNR